MLVLILAAFLPPPGLHYAERIRYTGPGLVCGAAFSVELKAEEHAELVQRDATDAETTFSLRGGEFAVRESQRGISAGTIVRKYRDGTLSRERVRGRYIWHYYDNAPGSTDVYGPSIGATITDGPVSRVEFGSPKNGTVNARKCSAGIASDSKVSRR